MFIRRVYIDRRARSSPIVQSFLDRTRLSFEVVESAGEVYHHVSQARDPVQYGKECLFLTVNRGDFVRKCPGTAYYTCCGYMILHIGTYCYMDCAYCILQTYFHPPVLQLFVNHETMNTEIDRFLQSGEELRIGTGEFTDSLIWDHWVDLSSVLIPKFAAQSRAMLEIKTKTAAVAGLKSFDHNRKTVVAWSLNTETVIRCEERKTSPLEERLRAARQCQDWGYPLAFHFDPLAAYDGCEAEYESVIERLFNAVSPENVVWISIGAFRFPPALKPVIQRRFPESKIVYGEFIPGIDGKMRYFKPVRMLLYQCVIAKIRQAAPEVAIYFCMEDDEVWKKCMGFVPEEKGGLSRMLDESAIRVCGLR